MRSPLADGPALLTSALDVTSRWRTEAQTRDLELMLETVTHVLHAEETIRALLNDALAAQEAERRRIAYELQAETAQSLASLLVGLKTVEESHDLGQAKGAASTVRGLVSAALDGVQCLARGLGPGAPTSSSRPPARLNRENHYVGRGGFRTKPAPRSRYCSAPQRALHFEEKTIMTLRLWIPIAAFVFQGACATTNTAPVVAVPSLGAEDSSGAIRAAEEVGAAHNPEAALHLELAKEQFEHARKLTSEDERPMSTRLCCGPGPTPTCRWR